MYWWGLIILAIATGVHFEQSAGWMVLGGGMVLFVLLRAVFLRISVTRKD